MIGISVALALVLINPSISPINALNTKSCTTAIGFKYYSEAGIADSVKNSQMMAVGTISNVETQVTEYFRPVSEGTNSSDVKYARADAAPWRVVVFDIEKYLFDKTAKYSEEITFSTPSNKCVDKFGIISSDSGYVPGSSPEFEKGERALIDITDVTNGTLYSLGGYKMDLIDDELAPNEKMGIGAGISVQAIETEIMNEVMRQNSSSVLQ